MTLATLSHAERQSMLIRKSKLEYLLDFAQSLSQWRLDLLTPEQRGYLAANVDKMTMELAAIREKLCA